MLDLINQARDQAGAHPLTLSLNDIAQDRADQLLQECTFAHWSSDGLKPYMRYSLTGGHQKNAENIYTANECGLIDTHAQVNQAPEDMVKGAMTTFLNSPGHREAIISPSHSKVSIGLAWDRHTFKAVQHFEGDYVRLERIPRFLDGSLHVAGAVQTGYTLQGEPGRSP